LRRAAFEERQKEWLSLWVWIVDLTAFFNHAN
jgi:hypothetical protein